MCVRSTQIGGRVARQNGPVARSTRTSTASFRLRPAAPPALKPAAAFAIVSGHASRTYFSKTVFRQSRASVPSPLERRRGWMQKNSGSSKG